MSAQYRAELCKLVAKYARTFGVHGEDKIHCPSRPDLPRWGMGNNSEEWQDGPRKPAPIVSRRKR